MKYWCGVAASFALISPGSLPADQLDPVVQGRTGDFRALELTLSEGTNGGAQTLFLSFRDGALANFWFVDQGVERINLVESSLALSSANSSSPLARRRLHASSRSCTWGDPMFTSTRRVKVTSKPNTLASISR